MNRSGKVGIGRACTMEAKALSFTHRTKVIADGTGRKNNARSRRWIALKLRGGREGS